MGSQRYPEDYIEVGETRCRGFRNKKGAKKNTLVATVKSHTHAVPTLLIEHT